MLENSVPLLVAFAGALFGAYFALVKSQRERLWVERHEMLVSIVKPIETVKAKFLAMKAGPPSVETAYTEDEISTIEREWAEARHVLASKVTLARLIFKTRDAESLVNAHQDLDRAISNVLAGTTEDQITGINQIWAKANSVVEAAIVLHHKRCG